MFVYGRRKYRRKYKITREVFRGVGNITRLFYIVLIWIIATLFKVCRWSYFKIKFKDTYYSKEKFWKVIMDISPRQFEVFCCELYKALGYKAKITKATHDGGVDVILRKGNSVIYVECKHYNKNSYIGREICQKLLGSCVMNGADKAVVFTTGGIHRNAKECESKVDSLKIVDYDGIYNMFNKLDNNKRSKIISKIYSF